MKRFLIEYVEIVGYVTTGLVFALASFVLFINFYHYKEVNTSFVKNEKYENVYEQNKEKIAQIRNNAASYDANQYRGNSLNFTMLSVKSGLEICADKYEESRVNKIFAKKKITVRDDYRLLSYYQSDIINDCIVLHIYSMNVEDTLNSISTYSVIKPFVDVNTKAIVNDMDYVKRTLQMNSSYQFASDYSRSSVFNVTRDSYARIENSYVNSLDFVVAFSEWFRKTVEGGI